jgi:hypothetical protein
VGGLEGSKKEEGNEGVGQAPADLHPPLIADKGALGPFDKLRDRLNKRGQVSFSALNIFYSWFRHTAEKET